MKAHRLPFLDEPELPSVNEVLGAIIVICIGLGFVLGLAAAAVIFGGLI